LPIPASPLTSTTPPSPSAARSSACSSSARCASRSRMSVEFGTGPLVQEVGSQVRVGMPNAPAGAGVLFSWTCGPRARLSTALGGAAGASPRAPDPAAVDVLDFRVFFAYHARVPLHWIDHGRTPSLGRRRLQ